MRAAAAFLLCAGPLRAQGGSGVSVEPMVERVPAASGRLVAAIRLNIPEGIEVYGDADHFFQLKEVHTDGLGDVELAVPDPVMVPDAFAVGETTLVPVYRGRPVFQLEAPVRAEGGQPWQMRVQLRFQACSQTLCYPPETHTFRWSGTVGENDVAIGTVDGTMARATPAEERVSSPIPADFEVTAQASGYMGRKKFLQFLAEGRGEAEASRGLADILQDGSVWLGLLLVLVAGVALNLTPCVLPMIPVNLAIIGAGAQASTRLRGFLMGGLYGLAIALTYGVLGLVVVLGGGTFGAINASPVFNLAIAVLFLVLAAAMLGVFNIDFSRFSSGMNVNRWKGTPALLAAAMGVVTAVLAGACVAPVVIAVVLVATRQYAAGNAWALLYPFVLGLGMGAPWPVAGAGLSFLPKPGGWMKWVKIAFGVFFIGLAVYYGALGARLWGAQQAGGEADAGKPDFWVHSLDEAFETARETDKPVLIDFATPWCKTCHAMDQTTLASPDVQNELRRHFVPLAFMVEDTDDPESVALVEQLGVIGYPTYVVLQSTK